MNRIKGFLSGFASAFDLTGGGYLGRPYRSRGFERDREAFARDGEALSGDWRQVGDDMRWAMDQMGVEVVGGRKERTHGRR